MNEALRPKPTVMIIFGAGGDLTWRKLMPALVNLYLDQWLPEPFAIIGIDMREMDQEQFRARLREGIDQFSRRGKIGDAEWAHIAPKLFYFQHRFDEESTYAGIAAKIAEFEKEWKIDLNRLFYLATPPRLVPMIVQQLGKAGLAEGVEKTRIVVEKPFGHDLESARTLNGLLTSIFHENQIYRIDHYLGKETVQNILAFRFANALFEPMWDRRYIDHVQITVSEEIGVENRGTYYDQAGELRDMIQNHLLQLLCLIAMESPVMFTPNEIRNKKVDVLRAIRPLSREIVHHVAARGQYGPGWIEGQKIPGYRQDQGVNPESSTETFAALKLFIDNWRWQDVPFYIRAGKRMPMRATEVSIQFQPVPHRSFPDSAAWAWQPNRLILHIQPDEGISLRFMAKQPGPELRLSPVDMRFKYADAFRKPQPEAYETLLLDAMEGDSTLFMRADQVEEAWRVVMPVLEVWETASPIDFPNYEAGSWGPDEAEVLIAQDKRTWVAPTRLEQAELQHAPKISG